MTRMALPLRKSRKPKHNAPVWATTSTSGIVSIVLALQADGVPVAVQCVVVAGAMILGFIGGLIAQTQTTPA